MIEPQSRAPGQTVFYAILLAGSAVLLREAYRVEGIGSLSGAGMFPMIAAAAMMACILLLLVGSIRARPVREQPPLPLPERVKQIITLPMIGYMVVCALYVVALEYAGFWAASTVFLFFSFAVLHRQGVVRAGLVTLASLAFVYVIFSFIFQVYLP